MAYGVITTRQVNKKWIRIRDGNGLGKVLVEQIPARDNTRNYKVYPYPRSLAGKILYPYPYPPGTGRVSGTHRVF